MVSSTCLGAPASRARAAVGVVFLALLLTLADGLAFGRPAHGSAAARGSTSPNIVFVLTDDMRLDELKWLPAVQALARRGVNFRQMRSSDSLCCPARATILTGKYAHNHRTLGNSYSTYGGYQWFNEHNNVNDLLGTWLQKRGYVTGWVGKYLNGFEENPQPTMPGWDAFDVPQNNVYNYQIDNFLVDGQPQSSTEYREIYTRGLALNLLDRWGSRPRHKPYFLMYNSLAPHDVALGHQQYAPPLPEPQYDGSVNQAELKPEASVFEKDLSDKPAWVQRHARYHRSGYEASYEEKRIEALKSVNDTVQAIVDKVRTEGDLANTLFIFGSDNGLQLGEHGLNGKAKPYEESDRVPLVLAGPGFAGGVKRFQDVTLADVTATILAAAKDPGTHGGDGRALQPFATSASVGADRPIIIEGSNSMMYSPAPPVDSIGRAYSGVIWHHWSYVTYPTGMRELYDLATDPLQMHNIARPPRRATRIQRKLAGWLALHKNCARKDCNTPLH